jgi:hypothetical protein
MPRTTILSFLFFAAVLGLGQAAWGCGTIATPAHLQQLVGEDATARSKVIERLRDAGPDALPILFKFRENLQTLQAAARQTGKDDQLATEQLARLESAIDAVAGQRHACHSQLYWYTDLDQAKAVAEQEKKPILSLRMLGNLTEDFSCANSRFFRTTLYANADISKLLRERFVLHWKSVRPVPKVTIDFGDGRKLERTLTGNSIHYVLAADAQIIDALPGLYGPAAFLQHLNNTLVTAAHAAELGGEVRAEYLVAQHQQALVQLDARWAADFQAASRLLNQPAPTSLEEIKAAMLRSSQPAQQQVQAPAPPAAKAVKVAVTKSLAVEEKLVRAVAPAAPADPLTLNDERLWQVIAELHAKDAKLDAASLNLIRSENPTAARAGRLSVGKGRVEDPVLRMVRSLESSIAVDTVRNEYQLHRQIHQWLAVHEQLEVENFNERVYAQLFLTPSSDPWLGLAPADAYSALPNAGVAGK